MTGPLPQRLGRFTPGWYVLTNFAVRWFEVQPRTPLHGPFLTEEAAQVFAATQQLPDAATLREQLAQQAPEEVGVGQELLTVISQIHALQAAPNSVKVLTLPLLLPGTIRVLEAKGYRVRQEEAVAFAGSAPRGNRVGACEVSW